jgi:hypothetical protein
MGQFLTAATVFQTVANQVPQLSQPRSTLRHCASCLSPYGGKALTGAVLLRGLLAQKRSVANYPTAWRFRPDHTEGTSTAPVACRWMGVCSLRAAQGRGTALVVAERIFGPMAFLGL